MPGPIRLTVPADPRWLGVIDLVVGAAPRFVYDEAGVLDDLAIAVGEVAAEVGATAGVAELEVTVDDDRVEIAGRGTDVVWEPGPVWERLVPGLAEVGWDVEPSGIRVWLAPLPA
ncbi:MAG: hypothetical protein AB1Z57_04125 [Acidimicrobiia bacterium]